MLEKIFRPLRNNKNIDIYDSYQIKNGWLYELYSNVSSMCGIPFKDISIIDLIIYNAFYARNIFIKNELNRKINDKIRTENKVKSVY